MHVLAYTHTLPVSLTHQHNIYPLSAAQLCVHMCKPLRVLCVTFDIAVDLAVLAVLVLYVVTCIVHMQSWWLCKN